MLKRKFRKILRNWKQKIYSKNKTDNILTWKQTNNKPTYLFLTHKHFLDKK